jgi:hypothetical protein
MEAKNGLVFGGGGEGAGIFLSSSARPRRGSMATRMP